ncbi:MAG: prolyl oligopeptidase family serine peptidase [Phycisphaerales bacterium]|nr:prolyl oligopeptidase family serine peptidase [Phycisphaerales bacterium]
MADRRNIRVYVRILSALSLVFCAGCMVVDNRPAPGQLLLQTDPEYGRNYHLYVPSRNNQGRAWPLIIACHGTIPWDSADRQVAQWKGLAEEKGFLVAAPELRGTKGDFPPATEEQIRRQLEDEKIILSVVKAIRAARNVDENRVFLTGWSAGAYAVLFTGLRNPDTFRAIAVSQGNFKADFVEPCIPFIDRYQPVNIVYNSEDLLLKADAPTCIDWLRAQGMHPTVLERPGIHKRDPEPIFNFFVDCARRIPWIRVSVTYDPGDPMEVAFIASSSFEPTQFLWDFGDETRASSPAPRHRYEKPGRYLAKAALWAPNGKSYVRQISLQVPPVRLGAAASAPASP